MAKSSIGEIRSNHLFSVTIYRGTNPFTRTTIYRGTNLFASVTIYRGVNLLPPYFYYNERVLSIKASINNEKPTKTSVRQMEINGTHLYVRSVFADQTNLDEALQKIISRKLSEEK